MVTNLRQLVDKEMEVEFAADADKRATLYTRLYENTVMCKNVSEFLGKL